MNTLLEVYNYHLENSISKTDKGTVHCYIENFYDKEFSNKQNNELRIVEIGAACGQSLKLWRDFFKKAEIFSYDINPCGGLELEVEGVTIYYKDAYLDDNVNIFDDNTLDYVIDDGPHNFDSQMACISKWYPKLKSKGVLVIEDIPHIDFTVHFKNLVEESDFDCTYEVLDYTEVNGRFDDIMFIVRKN